MAALGLVLGACATTASGGGTAGAAGADEAEPDAAAVDEAEAAGAGVDEGAAAEEAAAAEEDAGPVRGSVYTRYRYRAVDGQDDQDLAATVAIDVGDPDEDELTAHGLAWLAWDVDGSVGSAFADVTDTYDDDVKARLYSAYVDHHGVDELQTLRLGRQELFETPVFLTFDGIRAETAPRGEDDLELEAYGGVPTHFFESSSDGDLVAGVAASARPWKGGRVRLDWMHLEDESLLGDLANDLVGMAVWHSFGPNLSVDGRANLLEGDGRDLLLRGTWLDAEDALLVQSTYKVLFEPQESLVTELDPFTASLLTLEPYHRWSVLASKELRETWAVDGGFELRELLDSEDEGEFNRDYGRVHASSTWLDVLDTGVEATLLAERWEADGIATSSWGADLSRPVGESLEASAGTWFALYKADFLLLEERENVRTYYAELEWGRVGSRTFDVRYEYENGPFDDYHLLKIGMRWTF